MTVGVVGVAWVRMKKASSSAGEEVAGGKVRYLMRLCWSFLDEIV